MKESGIVGRLWDAELDSTKEKEAVGPNPPQNHQKAPSKFHATQAKIKLFRMEKTLPVKEGVESVTFRMELKAGRTRLQIWFMGGGKSKGAYFVYVWRLED